VLLAQSPLQQSVPVPQEVPGAMQHAPFEHISLGLVHEPLLQAPSVEARHQIAAPCESW
jgi:hypothetical protein